ncbi:MAG: GldG family protein [Magnetococcales bacterium]|nr:GldG family protein [Magnetococcales bacterium]
MEMNRSTRFNLKLQNHTTTLLLLLLLLIGAYASQRYQVQWDWTAEKRRSLSEQTIKAMQQLPPDISATLFFRKSDGEDQRLLAMELLQQYQLINPKMEIRSVDVALDPAAARQAEITTNGTVVLRSGERSEKVTELSEEALTNALIRLTRDSKKQIRFVTGHGEPALAGKNPQGLDVAVALLKGEGYQVDTLNLAAVEQIPADTAVVVLAGQRKPLLPIERERLNAWLVDKGRLLLLSDPGTTSGLEEILQSRGLRWQPGIVIDPVARLFGGGPTTPLVSQYDTGHAITKNLASASFFPEAQALLLDSSVTGVQTTRLFSAAEKGWVETGDLSSGQVEFNPDSDVKGPVVLGAALEQGKQRWVVVGDADFVVNSYINFSGNGDLFLNMVRWLSEDENFIAIKPKKISDAGLMLQGSSLLLIFWMLVLVIPLAMVATGVLIWRRRRQQ